MSKGKISALGPEKIYLLFKLWIFDINSQLRLLRDLDIWSSKLNLKSSSWALHISEDQGHNWLILSLVRPRLLYLPAHLKFIKVWRRSVRLKNVSCGSDWLKYGSTTKVTQQCATFCCALCWVLIKQSHGQHLF